jgi:hypothetical protein
LNFKESYKTAQALTTKLLDLRMPNLVIEPFPARKRLCAYFKFVEVKIGKAKSFLARPSFSMPFVKPPNMIPNVSEDTIFSELNVI